MGRILEFNHSFDISRPILRPRQIVRPRQFWVMNLTAGGSVMMNLNSNRRGREEYSPAKKIDTQAC
jgi:hypothetical protein